MLYNIYKNISDEDFLTDKELLSIIEKQVMDLFISEGFYSNSNSPKNSDALALNFNTNKDGFGGNISLLFNDNESNPSYDLVLIKTYDEDGFRKYRRKNIIANVSLQEIRVNCKKLFLQAIEDYNSIKKEELSEKDDLNYRLKNIKNDGLKPIDFNNLPSSEE